MRLRMKCHACGIDVSGSRKAAIHIPYEEFGRVERETREWENKHAGDPDDLLGGLRNLSQLLTYPGLALWQVHCDRCNPHKDSAGQMCGGCYWFSLDRCATTVDLLYWTAHLMDKTWLEHTNWASFVRSAAKATGGREP